MYLVAKYQQFRRAQNENNLKKKAEKELQKLNEKIDKLLAKLDAKQATDDEEGTPITGTECVVCFSSTACMQTLPCNHRVVCRKCFVKTIQSAVNQRCLPLRCVICREKVLKLQQNQPNQRRPPPPPVTQLRRYQVHASSRTPPPIRQSFVEPVKPGSAEPKPILRRPGKKSGVSSNRTSAVTFSER